RRMMRIETERFLLGRTARGGDPTPRQGYGFTFRPDPESGAISRVDVYDLTRDGTDGYDAAAERLSVEQDAAMGRLGKADLDLLLNYEADGADRSPRARKARERAARRVKNALK